MSRKPKGERVDLANKTDFSHGPNKGEIQASVNVCQEIAFETGSNYSQMGSQVRDSDLGLSYVSHRMHK